MNRKLLIITWAIGVVVLAALILLYARSAAEPAPAEDTARSEQAAVGSPSGIAPLATLSRR